MKTLIALSLSICFLTTLLLGARLRTGAETEEGVRPARVERMQNLGVDAASSRQPVFVPAEWGRLVAVEKTDSLDYVLFLEGESGEIYVVRLIQNGDYLYLDTRDNGGVALVVKRQP
jgi:hypothetical protein